MISYDILKIVEPDPNDNFVESSNLVGLKELTRELMRNVKGVKTNTTLASRLDDSFTSIRIWSKKKQRARYPGLVKEKVRVPCPAVVKRKARGAKSLSLQGALRPAVAQRKLKGIMPGRDQGKKQTALCPAEAG